MVVSGQNMIQNPSGRWYRSVMVDGSRMGVLQCVCGSAPTWC